MTPDSSRTDIAEARSILVDAHRVVVLTGSGVSAESGVPTFRGAGGLWRSHRPEELATPEAFRRDPALVWGWYRWRRALVGACQPNPGHMALAHFALGSSEVDIVTQNVDGLHHRAAQDAAGAEDPSAAFPTELHGSLLRDRCSACGRLEDAEIPPPGSVPGPDDPQAGAVPPPSCTACQGSLRPDVVWFGETLDASSLENAFEAARAADACLVVGTSSLVYPAAGVPRAAVEAGRPVIEVNLEATPLTPYATCSLQAAAGEVLPRLLAV
jgi:NAD-dependent deacetylase